MHLNLAQAGVNAGGEGHVLYMRAIRFWLPLLPHSEPAYNVHGNVVHCSQLLPPHPAPIVLNLLTPHTEVKIALFGSPALGVC